MRPTTSLVAAAAAATLAIGPLAGMAGAQTAAGVGTGTVSATVLSVQLGQDGSLLSVRVLGDDGSSTNDPAKGAATSSQTLSPLTISSATVPALNVNVPGISTSSTGAEDKKSVEPSLPAVPGFSGQLNAVLSSVVDATGAHSGLQAGLANLQVAGGLLNVPTGVLQVSSAATSTSASGERSITIPAVTVLDLSAILEGLGLSLADLPLDVVLDLLGQLGVGVPNIADPKAAVDSLNAAIDTLQAQTGALTADVCNTVDSLLAGTVGGVTGLVGGVTGSLPTLPGTDEGSLPELPDDPTDPGITLPLPGILSVAGASGLHTAALPADFSCSNLTATVQDLLDEVQTTLSDLLAGILALLGDTPLLSVKDVKVGLIANATDTVEKSVANVTASIGEVKVGALPPLLSNLELAAPLEVINQAVAQIQGAVGSVLGTINPALADMVHVDVLKIDKAVSSAGGYVTAGSTITALKATLTPPNLLGAALIDLGTPVSSVIGDLGGTVPVLGPLMADLEAALGGLDALTGTSVVTVGQLSATGAFRPAIATTTGRTGSDLPRTGGNAALPAMLAVVLGGGAMAIRRLLRTAMSD